MDACQSCDGANPPTCALFWKLTMCCYNNPKALKKLLSGKKKTLRLVKTFRVYRIGKEMEVSGLFQRYYFCKGENSDHRVVKRYDYMSPTGFHAEISREIEKTSFSERLPVAFVDVYITAKTKDVIALGYNEIVVKRFTFPEASWQKLRRAFRKLES